ncbi:MAG TPA: transcriptional regulator [Allosphingosinicella sp.]|jgi:DNA-binding winged helix-turn-helix (wHTH) protein
MATVPLATAVPEFRAGSAALSAPEFASPPLAHIEPGRDEQEIRFENFVLCLRSRTLSREGRPIEIGSRAFELLHALLKVAGDVVSKDDLVRQVWPTTFVDESNLRFQMTCLRKALGPARTLIKTIPGRGYVFTGRCRGTSVAPLRNSGMSRLPFEGEPLEAETSSDCVPPASVARLLLNPASRPKEQHSTPHVEDATIGAPSGGQASEYRSVSLLIVATSSDHLVPGLLSSGAGPVQVDLSYLLDLLKAAVAEGQ